MANPNNSMYYVHRFWGARHRPRQGQSSFEVGHQFDFCFLEVTTKNCLVWNLCHLLEMHDITAQLYYELPERR